MSDEKPLRPIDPKTGKRRAGRPAVLSREQIGKAALAEIRDLSMAKVARAAGASTSSLYHHVSGRAELILLAADRAFATFEWPTPSEAGPRAYLEELADAYFAMLASYPGLSLAMQELDRVPEGVLDGARRSVQYLVESGYSRQDAEIVLALAAHLAADAALFAEARGETPAPQFDVHDSSTTDPRQNMIDKYSMVLDGLQTRRLT